MTVLTAPQTAGLTKQTAVKPRRPNREADRNPDRAPTATLTAVLTAVLTTDQTTRMPLAVFIRTAAGARGSGTVPCS